MSSTRGDKSGLVDNVEGSPVKKSQNHGARKSVYNDGVKKQDIKPVTVIVNVGKDDNHNHNKRSGTNRRSDHNHSDQGPKPVKIDKNNRLNPEGPVLNSSRLGPHVESHIEGDNQGKSRVINSNTNLSPTNIVHKSPTTVHRVPHDDELKYEEVATMSTRPIPIGIITPIDGEPIHNTSKISNTQAHLIDSQSPNGNPKSIVKEYADDVVYFHFKDKDQDDIRFRVNNLGTYVVINGQSFNGELLVNDGRFIKFKYTNKSGNTWFWTIDQVTKDCKGVSPRLFTNVEMKSILLNDSILMVGKQKLMTSY